MDLSRFGLRTRPFRSSPDMDAYYPATVHELALSQLRRGLDDDESILLLEGDPGTGKTLLAHLLLGGMPKATRSIFLTHGSFSRRSDLLQGILYDLDLPFQEMTEQELRLELIESCLDHFRQDGRTVIVADEAHLLSAAILEELRLLGNLEGKEGKAIQVVLIGLPSLMTTIDQPGMETLRQRLAVCCKLEPLSIEESADYLLHQIRRVGGRPEKILGDDVLDIISHASRGIPRLLNQAAHCAFSLAQEAGSDLVDAESAVEAVTRLGLDEGASEPSEIVEAAVREPAIKAPVDRPIPPLAVPAISVETAHDNGPPTYFYGGIPVEAETRFAQQRAG